MTHPITPPPELMQQWLGEFFGCTVSGGLADSERFLATRAAQWGADQELEACCAFAESQPWGLVNGPHVADVIRTARRPKQPSLKEQALIALHAIATGANNAREQNLDFDTIRRALEQLDD